MWVEAGGVKDDQLMEGSGKSPPAWRRPACHARCPSVGPKVVAEEQSAMTETYTALF